MSELTTEDLEKYSSNGKFAGDHEVRQMARELLSHRNSAAAGDEEVDELTVEAGNGIGTDYYIDKRGCNAATESLNKLRDIAITRGRTRTDAVNSAAEWANESERLEQQLRERDAEIERLKDERDNHERQHLHYRKLWDDANSKIEDIRTGVTQ